MILHRTSIVQDDRPYGGGLDADDGTTFAMPSMQQKAAQGPVKTIYVSPQGKTNAASRDTRKNERIWFPVAMKASMSGSLKPKSMKNGR